MDGCGDRGAPPWLLLIFELITGLHQRLERADGEITPRHGPLVVLLREHRAHCPAPRCPAAPAHATLLAGTTSNTPKPAPPYRPTTRENLIARR